MATTDELVEVLNRQHAAITAGMDKTTAALIAANSRLLDLEQRFAGLKPGGVVRRPGWGMTVATSDRLKTFIGDGCRGTTRIPITAALTTPTGIEQRDLVAPQRDGIQGAPQQKLTARDLLTVVPTTSNLIEYVRQTGRTNRAAPVEDAALKPESDLEFELAESPVRTLAHFVVAPRQTLDDVPELAALIDGELRFGLGLVEEQQILAGNGIGQDLLGLIPQAVPYAPPFAIEAENALDRILLMIVQAQQSRLPVDGVLINDITWAQLISLKDTQGRYLAGAGGGPFGSIPGLLWQVRVIPSGSMQQGECLVGSFRLGAKLHDRMGGIEVLLSSEDSDNFRRNLVTIRAEERVALSVRVPAAFVYDGQLPIGGTGT